MQVSTNMLAEDTQEHKLVPICPGQGPHRPGAVLTGPPTPWQDSPWKALWEGKPPATWTRSCLATRLGDWKKGKTPTSQFNSVGPARTLEAAVTVGGGS